SKLGSTASRDRRNPVERSLLRCRSCPEAEPRRGRTHQIATMDAPQKKPAPRGPAILARGAGCPGTGGSGRGVLQLLQRAHLDLHRSGLGGEPLLFLGERVDALAAR